ncbi:MAG TPA: MarR family transcriptional regulator [Acidimicrobiales bacterium]|nr:MarR family transcriptional regulator [Acidimicrobiales bacterium]
MPDLSPDPRAVAALRALARASSILERGSTELSLPQYRVLSAVAAGDEQASRIARKLAIGKPAVSATVDALRQRGLLTRVDSHVDHRVVALRLTPDGAAVLERFEAVLLERLDDLYRRTPDPSGVLDALVWLGTAVDARRAERDAARGETGPLPARAGASVAASGGAR